MSKHRNSVMIIGRVGNVPRVTITGDNNYVLNLIIYENLLENGSSFSQKHSIEIWGKSSFKIADMLSKGDEVVIIGGNLRYKNDFHKGNPFKVAYIRNPDDIILSKKASNSNVNIETYL